MSTNRSEEGKLIELITQIHFECCKLIKQALGYYLPCAGNVGVFCQSDEEYKFLTELRKKLTEASENPKQKYFMLTKPITILEKNGSPKMTYTYLYIRKPDPTPYGKFRGDVDFVMEPREYESFKKSILEGEKYKGAHVYERPGWDTVEITDLEIGSVAYISTKEFAEKVRVKF